MIDSLTEFLPGAAAGGGVVGVVAVILKFAGGRNALNQRQINEIFERQEARIAMLERDKEACTQRLMEMQRTLGSLEAQVMRLETSGITANIVADSTGTITEWNEGATLLFGWGRADAIGQQVTALIPLRMRGEHSMAFSKADAALSDPSKALSARVLESFALRRDGSEIPVAITLRGWMHDGTRLYSAEIRRR